MINEYLFLSDEYRDNVISYRSDKISVEVSNVENSSLWIASFSHPNNNGDAADKLSDVHEHLREYSPLVLSCESSEYYNRMLFPLANRLERKLRKLLYLAASISNNKEASISIQRLEEKDFGEIFDLLFIDLNFIKAIKTRINASSGSEFNGRSKYTKKEIQDYLETIEEDTLWNKILEKSDVPTLKLRFRDVQAYRNDIMHAHNIGKKDFRKAKYLFRKIGSELDIAIGKLIGTLEENQTRRNTDINAAISAAMDAMAVSISSQIDTLKDIALQSGISSLSQLSMVLPLQTQEAVDALSQSLLKLIQSSNDAYLESIEKLQAALDSSSSENHRAQLAQSNEAIPPCNKELIKLEGPTTLLHATEKSTNDNPGNLSKDENLNESKQQDHTANIADEYPREDLDESI